ncbi:MAG: host attachment protein [Oleiphilaceae bacterium]|nr:host attachment protein [Oleiphilaceae bacterium]
MTNPHFAMPQVRILVADASIAKLFRVDSPTGELIEIRTEENKEARLPGRKLTRDKPGEQTSHARDSRSQVDSAAEPKQNETHRFAQSIVEKLEEARTAGEIDKLYVIAPPGFLGELRQKMKPPLKSLLVEEINKDLTHLNARDLRKQLPERIK